MSKEGRSGKKSSPAAVPPPGGAQKARAQPQPSRHPDQGARQGFDRQRLEPANQPPAETRDEQNIAGEKDFELQSPHGNQSD